MIRMTNRDIHTAMLGETVNSLLSMDVPEHWCLADVDGSPCLNEVDSKGARCSDHQEGGGQ